jgi:two-component system sensor histidine kinase YesM
MHSKDCTGVYMKTKVSISSKKQIMFIMMIVVIPLHVILIIYNIYTVNSTNDRVFESSKNTIYLYQQTLENDLHNVENSMVALSANDSSYRYLHAKLNPYDANAYTYNIIEKYRDIILSYPMIGGMFIFTDSNQLYRDLYSNTYSYKEKNDIKGFLRNLTESNGNYGTLGWFSKKIEDRYYLFRVLGKNGLYIICMIDFDRIIKPQDSKKRPQDGFLLYSTKNGDAITLIDKVQSEKIDLMKNTESYNITGTKQAYFTTQNYSDYAQLNFVYLEPYHGFFNHDTVLLGLLVATAVFVLIVPVYLYLFEHSYFQPFERLVNTMNRIKAGDLDAKMENNYRINEFQSLCATFNEMVEKIKNLKVESYEKELEKQQAQLQYLQLQIKPHFYLNCLKSLFGMAQEQKYIQIQKMIIELSGYLRYMLSNNARLVSFSEELNSIQNYISLQKMSASNPPICQINISEQIENIQIPPLSILTFVENSVKYGVCRDKQLIIKIKIMLLESEQDKYVNITISDNGNGFPEEILEKLNQNKPYYESGHTGIANVKHRLNLIYQNKSTFSFSNQIEGSCIEIFIPYEK